jgi:cyanophycinase-like exopeptidase
VIYFPTAAANEGKAVVSFWAEKALTHLQAVGAIVEIAMILNRAQADNPPITSAIEQADVIYLGGGLPQVYLEILRDTATWQAIIRRHQAGAWIFGASAGAMILGEACLVTNAQGDYPPDEWSRGFGLLPGVGIAPHFDTFSHQWIDNITTTRPEKIQLLGIDEQTALVAQSDGWQVIGRGKVVRLSANQQRQFDAESRIPFVGK